MKPSTIVTLLFAVIAFAPGPAVADRDAPIENPAGIPISWNAAGEPALERIQRAIIAGCIPRGWKCQAIKPGEIRAVLHLRQHMAEALIAFDTKSFSVTYVDSSELRYNATEKTIHRKYNQWVANLITDINTAIGMIQ
jgi:hypothetical protein